MAMAKKCDVCGKYYDENKKKRLGSIVLGVSLIQKDPDGRIWNREEKDLCDECLETLDNWLGNKSNLK